MMRWPVGEMKPDVAPIAGGGGEDALSAWSMMSMKPLGPTSSPNWVWVCSRAFSDGGR